MDSSKAATIEALRCQTQALLAARGGSCCDEFLSGSKGRVACLEAGDACDDERLACSGAGVAQRTGNRRAKGARNGRRGGLGDAGSARRPKSSEPSDPVEKTAYARALELATYCERCTSQLERRLFDEGYAVSETKEAVDRLKSYGIVDDGRYARMLVRKRVAAGKGELFIEQELKSLRIDPASVEGWPHEFVSADDQFDRALAVLRRQPPHGKDVRAGAYRKLASRGYPYAVCMRAASAWFDEYQGNM